MNLTLSVDEQTVERAREVARQQGKSLNALIRDYLERLAGRQGGQHVADNFRALWNERSGHSGGWHFDREELYQERLGYRRGETDTGRDDTGE